MKENIIIKYIWINELLIRRKGELEDAKKKLSEMSSIISQKPDFENIKAVMEAEEYVNKLIYFVERESAYLRSLEKDIIVWLRNNHKPKVISIPFIYIPAQCTQKRDLILRVNYEDWEITIETQNVDQN